MKYNKLVRDKNPDIIKQKGSTPVIKIASDEEYLGKLIEKFKEESDEFLKEFSEEELADLLEVIYAICDFKKINRENLEILITGVDPFCLMRSGILSLTNLLYFISS